ncbi:MAG: hypothetical protein ACR2FS_09650 [Phormidesmis sp.]
MRRVIRLFPQRRQAINSEKLPESYARSPEGQAIIRLRLSSPAALLMPFESFPINFGKEDPEKDAPVLNLNQDFVDYLFARIAELGDESLLLRITLPAETTDETADEPASKFSAQALHAAVQRYFAYLESVCRQSLKKLAWDAALLGLLGSAALGLSAFLEVRNAAVETGIGLLLLSQGVTVFGWLTFWEALANALWNWRPLYRQLRMCQRLQLAQLELAADVS